MLAPERLAGPANLPIALHQAKQFLRIDILEDDPLIEGLITAATGHLDGPSGLLNRAILDQNWRIADAQFGTGVVPLGFPDVSDLTVRYLDTAGQLQTLSTAAYRLHEDANGAYVRFMPNFVAPALSDEHDAVRYEFTMGYGPDPADVPPALVQAMLMLVAQWYEHREGVVYGDDMLATSLPNTVAELIVPHIWP